MSEKKSSDWMQQLWRPMMGWMYMLICTLDMAVFPVLWSLLQAVNHLPITQWNPLTLQGAGLFHIAMGAVLGISAFGRTQEKLAGTAANPTATTTTTNNNFSGLPAGGSNAGFGSSGGFGSTPSTGNSGGFGSSSGGFGSAAPGGFSSPTSGGFGGGGFGSTSGTASSGFGGSPTTAQPVATTASGKKIVPDDPNAFPLQ